MHKDIYRIKVIIVDDEPKILNHIVSKVKLASRDCDIVATANNGTEALEAIESHRPHIVFTDIKMPGMDGLALSQEIKRRFPGIFVVIISGFSDFSFAQQAIRYGVFNYLLKPIEQDKLMDTINDIRDKLEGAFLSQSRAITLPNTVKKHSRFKEELLSSDKYGIFVICFNNLCYDNLDEYLLDYYAKELGKLDWDNIISELRLSIHDWLIIDEYYINQKSLLLGISNHQKIYLEEAAHRLSNLIRKRNANLFVNICCHSKPLDREQIWLYTQRMRNILQNSVILTKPTLFVVEKDENKAYMDRLYTIKLRIDKNLKAHIKSKNYDKLYDEVTDILRHLAKVKINQKQYEKVLVNMLQLFELYFDGYDTIWSEKLQIDLFRTINFAKDYVEIEKAFFECIRNFMKSNQTVSKSKDIQTEILNYVDKNYVTINKVEEVAEVFNYNYTYLSRLFKKMTGTTMIKYITAKRVEAAKNIMEQNKDIGLGKVGEMVGYTDQHYFSRTFKLLTGISPSEYRAKLE